MVEKWKIVVDGGIDGNVTLFGVNIFDCDWQNTDEKIVIEQPDGYKLRLFVYETIIDNKNYVFAAGEIMMGVWVFAIPE